MQDSGDMAAGLALAQQGQREAAYARLRKAIFSEGDSAELRIQLAELAPSTAERVQHLERAAALEPEQPQVAAALTAARAQWATEAHAPAPPPSAAPPAPAWPRPVQITPGSGELAPPAPSPFGGFSAPAPPPSAPVDAGFTPAWASPPATPAPAPPAWTAPPVTPALTERAAAPLRPLPPAPSRLAPAAPPAPALPADPAADPAADFDWFARAVEEPAPGPVRPHSVGDALRNRSPGLRRPLAPPAEAAPAGNAPPMPLYSGASAPVVYPDPAPYHAGAETRPAASGASPTYIAGAPGTYTGPAELPPAPGNIKALQAAIAPAAPAARRRTMLPLLALLLVVVLLGGGALVLGGGLGHSNSGTNTAQATAVGVAAMASATGAAVAAEVQATAAALPTLTAQAASQAYSDSVTALMDQIRANDREVADTVHQTSQGGLTTDEAATQLRGYITAGDTYKTAVERLNPPLSYTAHRSRLLDALDARAHALDTASAYLDKLGQIPDATQAGSAAESDFRAAQQAAQRNGSNANVAKAIQTKRAFDTAQAALTRLQTYADQTEQQFETDWSAYNAALPPLPQP